MPQILLIVVDALTSRVVEPAMQAGRLPTLAALAARGQVRFDCRSIFPSITPAATSTIITGRYPCDHGIGGASWFDAEREEVAYYGDDFWTILQEGTGHFFRDFLLRLNGERLTAPTLFQTVERAGLSAACLNYLVYRGDVTHRIRVPLPLALLPGVPFAEHVEGPSTLCLGDFVAEGPGSAKLRSVGGMRHRFGMDDAGTAGYLAALAGQERLPDLAVAYFADNDYEGHKVGPQEALPVVERVDGWLGELLTARGGIDAALADLCLVITGDHSHTDIHDDASVATLDLDTTLADLILANPGKSWTGDAQVMVCPNMRAAQIYLREGFTDVQAVVAALLAEPRVDQVMWPTSKDTPGDVGFCVKTSGRGELHVAMATGAEGTPDEYGGRWTWRGDLRAVDARIDDTGRVVSDAYPNAFERIAGGLRHASAGDLWVTAVPGVELMAPGGGVHVGGASHGSLHVDDSLVPLIVAGGGVSIDWEAPPRTVDIAAICLRALGLTPAHDVGESHAAGWGMPATRG